MVVPWISTGSVRPTTSGTAHCWAVRSGAPASRPWRSELCPKQRPWGNMWKTYGKPMENLWKTYGNLWKTYGKPMDWKSPNFINFLAKAWKHLEVSSWACSLLMKWNREFVVSCGLFLLVQSLLFVAQTIQRFLLVQRLVYESYYRPLEGVRSFTKVPSAHPLCQDTELWKMGKETFQEMMPVIPVTACAAVAWSSG